MPKERLYLFDTTLRDGAQTNGVDFTLTDKLAIAGMLDELGIDYVEGLSGCELDRPNCSGRTANSTRLHGLWHGATTGPVDVQRPRPCGAA